MAAISHGKLRTEAGRTTGYHHLHHTRGASGCFPFTASKQQGRMSALLADCTIIRWFHAAPRSGLSAHSALYLVFQHVDVFSFPDVGNTGGGRGRSPDDTKIDFPGGAASSFPPPEHEAPTGRASPTPGGGRENTPSGLRDRSSQPGPAGGGTEACASGRRIGATGATRQPSPLWLTRGEGDGKSRVHDSVPFVHLWGK